MIITKEHEDLLINLKYYSERALLFEARSELNAHVALDHLKYACKKLSQRKIASMLKISEAFLSDILSKKRKLGHNILIKICKLITKELLK